MSFDGNLRENYRRWSQRFTLYMKATEKDKKPQALQAATFLHLIGEEGLEVYNTFNLSAEETDNVDILMTKFREYCDPRKNIVYERHMFFNRSQQPGEKVDNFITDLKRLSSSCEFGELRDSLIRDRIVGGIMSQPLKQRMLRDNDLTLDKAVSMAHAEEQTMVQLQAMDGEKCVDVVSSKGKYGHKKNRETPSKANGNCSKCNSTHPPKACPAFGKKCLKCGKHNHFAKCCRTKTYTKSVHVVEGEEEETPVYWLGIIDLDSQRENIRAWYVTAAIEGQKVRMKVDTGAEANVIPFNQWKAIKGGGKLEHTKVKLKGFNNTDIEVKGVAEVNLKVGDQTVVDKVFVTASNSCAVMGLRTAMAFKLVDPNSQAHLQINGITLDNLIDTHKDVFEGLGAYPDQYHITLEKDAKPVIHPPRRVPPALHKQLKEKLDSMMDEGVIAPVDQPTEWVNSLVIAQKKNGDLRLCLDPKDLNKHIQREQFEIPTFDQVASTLGGKKVFTILDQKDSYWQVRLDDESSYLTTFNTPFGRYRFRRMPFGISSASEILQKQAYKTFGDITGVYCLSDDTLVAADSDEEHDEIINKVMQRARERGVKFNPRKVQFKKPEVKYMGRIISAEGIRPDPEKIKALSEMPRPSNVKDIQRLLGMVNFLAPFIPNMSQVTSPLRNLIKKEIQWHWGPEHEKSIQDITEILGKDPVLKLFDPKEKATIQCDSSSEGLGACLLQEGQPIAYASKALTDSEKNWAQIEKEMLAIVFAAEHFHDYIFGQEIEVQSDHKPLQSIIKKPIHKASPRMQVMMLRLLRYNLEVKYRPGPQMFVADALSRAFPAHRKEMATKEEENTLRVLTATATAPASPNMKERIKQETRKDPTLSKVLKYVKSDEWMPVQKNDEAEMKKLKSLKDEIHEENGIVFYEDRIIVPRTLRQEIIQNLHTGHFGMEKCKSRARQSIYWPNLTRDIEDCVRKCATCDKFKNDNHREPMIPHPVPDGPWKKLGADIFHYGGKDFLVIVDYFSKYPEVTELKQKTAKAVITGLKPILARHGIPDEIIADNNPFGSLEMKQFAQSWNFQIRTSSPRYPQSNGQAERFVKIIKDILKKSKDPNASLLAYRNTPVTGLKYSPAEMLMGRRLIDLVPAGLNPTSQQKNMKEELKRVQTKAKSYYDRAARQRSPFDAGKPVTVRIRPGHWEKAAVVNKCDSPRSYTVVTESGASLRRNSRFLRKSYHTPVALPSLPEDQDDQPQRSDHANTQSTGTESQVGLSCSPNQQDDALSNPVLARTAAVSSQTNAPYTTRYGRVIRKPNKYAS